MADAAFTPFSGAQGLACPSPPLLAQAGKTCRLRLSFALFFDGTNNNRDEDAPSLSHSNVASACGAIPPAGVCRSFMRACAMSLLVLLLAACGRDDDTGTFGSSVIAMDHDPSDTFVRTVYVNGNWVGSAGTGGKSVAGGISLPRRWHPDLTAVVRWERCDRFDRNNPVPDEIACRWTEKVVPITRYEHVGHTDVHIMEHDKVLIIPTMFYSGHPNYVGPGDPTKDFFSKQGNQQKGETE